MSLVIVEIPNPMIRETQLPDLSLLFHTQPIGISTFVSPSQYVKSIVQFDLSG